MWTPDGREVRAVNEAIGPALDTGATATIGFVGTHTGPNVLPAVFTAAAWRCHPAPP